MKLQNLSVWFQWSKTIINVFYISEVAFPLKLHFNLKQPNSIFFHILGLVQLCQGTFSACQCSEPVASLLVGPKISVSTTVY